MTFRSIYKLKHAALTTSLRMLLVVQITAISGEAKPIALAMKPGDIIKVIRLRTNLLISNKTERAQREILQGAIQNPLELRPVGIFFPVFSLT